MKPLRLYAGLPILVERIALNLSIHLSDKYNWATGRGALWIILLLGLSGLMLDFGETLQITVVSGLAYFGGVTVMMIRRPQSPTAADLWLLRWGFLPLWFATQIIARLLLPWGFLRNF